MIKRYDRDASFNAAQSQGAHARFMAIEAGDLRMHAPKDGPAVKPLIENLNRARAAYDGQRAPKRRQVRLEMLHRTLSL